MSGEVDGTLYLPYRAIFLIQQGRLGWVEVISRLPVVVDPDNDVLDPDSYRMMNEGFEEFLRDFERARAGLSASNNLTLALADLYSAEACLAHARLLVARGTSDPDGSNCLRYARARHKSVRTFLQRARAELMAAPRNVVWWRLFYQLTTQYYSDRMLLGSARFAASEEANVATYLARLKRGLESYNNAIGLHLNLATSMSKLVWLPRAGRELAVGAAVMGFILCHRQNNVPASARSYVWKQLEWVFIDMTRMHSSPSANRPYTADNLLSSLKSAEPELWTLAENFSSASSPSAGVSAARVLWRKIVKIAARGIP